MIAARCDDEPDMTAALCARHLGLLEHETTAIMRDEPTSALAADVRLILDDSPDITDSTRSISMEPA